MVAIIVIIMETCKAFGIDVVICSSINELMIEVIKYYKLMGPNKKSMN